MQQGYTLIELLVVLIILGILLLAVVPRFIPVFRANKPSTYCTLIRSIRTYLEMEKEKDIIGKSYPSSITTASVESVLDINLIDPYTGHRINITRKSSCDSGLNTDTIEYCPVMVNNKVFSYRLGVSRVVTNDIYSGCLLGVDK